MKCPKCEREWPDECQQAECVQRHGECICCRFLPRGPRNLRGSASGTDAEFDALSSAAGTVAEFDALNSDLPPNNQGNRTSPSGRSSG